MDEKSVDHGRGLIDSIGGPLNAADLRWVCKAKLAFGLATGQSPVKANTLGWSTVFIAFRRRKVLRPNKPAVDKELVQFRELPTLVVPADCRFQGTICRPCHLLPLDGLLSSVSILLPGTSSFFVASDISQWLY